MRILRHYIASLASILAGVLVFSVLEAAEAAVHKPVVQVDTAVVTVGDLFEPAGSEADTPVLRAPRPGHQILLDTKQIAHIARTHGIEWKPALGDETMLIERRAFTLGRPEFEALISEELIRRGLEGSFEVELGTRTPELYLPVDQPDGLSLDELRFDDRSARLSAIFTAPRGDPRAERVRVVGRIYRTEEVPVLSRRISPGQRIEETDIEWRMVRSERLKSGAVADPGALVGMVARRAIRRGDPVRANDVMEPLLVSKGQAVVMIFEQPGLLLTALGQAIEDGAEGQAVRIKNLQSNAIVQAIVTGPDTVTVTGAMQIGMN